MCIGLGIASDNLRAVGVRGAAVVWAVEAERRSDEDLSAAIVQLLQHATLPRWPRPVVVAAIGPAASQTKRIVGLPVTADVMTMNAIIREGSSRFFLRNGIPLITARVRMEEPGAARRGVRRARRTRHSRRRVERLVSEFGSLRPVSWRCRELSKVIGSTGRMATCAASS